jgi:purine-cytosine permease-like protein
MMERMSATEGAASSPAGRTFARRVFFGAGIYGLVVLLPQYFLEAQIGRDYPPPITHSEHFYGFVGVAVAWQIAFLIIASDVVRFRPLMLAAVVEKAGFAIPTFALFLAGRVAGATAAVAGVDTVLGLLFIAAYRATRPAASVL